MGELTKVRIKPRHFHEVVVYLPYRVEYNASTVFEARDVGEGWLLYGKVFHKKVFDIVEEEDMSRSEIVDKGSVGNKDQPFPIGSKVRRLNCSFQKLQVGEEYTVKGYSDFSHRNSHIFVEEHNIPAVDCSNFELVEDTPKSEWFGFEYKVFSSSSQLLQEAVFADGGSWLSGATHVQYTNEPVLQVSKDGRIKLPPFNEQLPEKEPPRSNVKSKEKLDTEYENATIPTVATSIELDTSWNFKKIVDNPKFNQQEDVNMSNVNRVVSVKFFDDDAGLKAEHALVAEYQVTTRVSDAMTVSKVLLTNDVAGDIDLHNKVRSETVDLHILKNTGNKVMLQPVEFEDLRVTVTNI